MKINIINLGPIENAQVEFAKLLIFTGDSNLGKSYVNYLMYYLIQSTSVNYLYKNFFSSKMKSKSSLEVSIDSLQKFLESKTENYMREFLNAPELTCNVQFDFQLDVVGGKYEIAYEEHEFEKGHSQELFANDLKSVTVTINGKRWTAQLPSFEDLKSFAVAIAFSIRIQTEIFGSVINQSLILPPARGAFVGENYTVKEKIASSVGMYRAFLRDYDDSTRPRPQRRRSIGKYASQIEALVNGKLISMEGVQYLQLKTGKKLPLSAAASSIKELSPLLYALQANPDLKQSFCIEEPEAHLHPQMQIAAVDLIANCYTDGKFFQFTTHSDYVVQRINQLIKLNYIKEHNTDKFSALSKKYNITKNQCINPKDIKVYYFSINDSKKVDVQDLPINDEGIPMVTFFEVVDSMTRINDDFDIVMEEIQILDK